MNASTVLLGRASPLVGFLVAAAFVEGCAASVNNEQAHAKEPADTLTADEPQRRPDVILGVGLYDNHFFMPFTLVRDEGITIGVQLERSARSGDLISCKLTSGDMTVSSDMGRACQLSASGHGLRYYVLHIYNADEQFPHQVFIDARRNKSRPGLRTG
jgi:hypothetical protein